MGSLGDIVTNLTHGRINKNSNAHLDPDLEPHAINRDPGWKPIFGQIGHAQSHLKKQGVTKGDIFLFFGWFRHVIRKNGDIRYTGSNDGVHVLWGWFQIGEIDVIDKLAPDQKPWTRYHPHFHQMPTPTNTLYTASPTLAVKNHAATHLPGSGVFHKFNESLLLTDINAKKKSIWKLPLWFYPSSSDSALSFHGDISRWEKHDTYVNLQSVGRGQEFVLDTDHYPESFNWIVDIIEKYGSAEIGHKANREST